MNMRKSVIVAVVSFATIIFGIEPSELVKLWRTALTNSEAMVELRGVLREHSTESMWELKSRMNGVELLLMYPAVDSVSATSESLIITFRDGGLSVTHNGVWRRVAEYIENNEMLILTPGQEASLADGFHGHMRLTPVSFKNKGKGFRVVDVFVGDKEWRSVGYIALSDKPTEVSEDDVESGQWIDFKKEGGAQVSPPSRNKVKKGKATTGDEPSEEESKASHFWLYVLLFHLILFPVFYFIRKKFSKR